MNKDKLYRRDILLFLSFIFFLTVLVVGPTLENTGHITYEVITGQKGQVIRHLSPLAIAYLAIIVIIPMLSLVLYILLPWSEKDKQKS